MSPIIRNLNKSRYLLVRNMHDSIAQIAKMTKAVWAGLGPGFTESVYHRALEKELQLLSMQYDSEVIIPFIYKNRIVGHGRGDLLIHRDKQKSILVELKATTAIAGDNDIMQLQRYMKFMCLDEGLLIHFGQKRGSSYTISHATLEVSRYVKEGALDHVSSLDKVSSLDNVGTK